MIEAIALIDIRSYGKGLKLYAHKGAKLKVKEYGTSQNNEALFLCQYKNEKFITNRKNIKLYENSGNAKQ